MGVATSLLKTLAIVTGCLALSGVPTSSGFAAHRSQTPSADPAQHLGRGTSTNWSGYVAHPGKFTEASAQWTQPSVTCQPGESSYSSFWAGIDGEGSGTVEQTGTDSDCNGGTPTYYAWYEMYPRASKANVHHAVNAGDTLTADVKTAGDGHFTLTLADATQGWRFSTQQALSSAGLVSAEVIAEAPSSRSGVLPLANFGTARFSASMANARPLGSFNPEELTMVSSGGAVKAQPSTLSGGTSFDVTWRSP